MSWQYDSYNLFNSFFPAIHIIHIIETHHHNLLIGNLANINHHKDYKSPWPYKTVSIKIVFRRFFFLRKIEKVFKCVIYSTLFKKLLDAITRLIIWDIFYESAAPPQRKNSAVETTERVYHFQDARVNFKASRRAWSLYALYRGNPTKAEETVRARLDFYR